MLLIFNLEHMLKPQNETWRLFHCGYWKQGWGESLWSVFRRPDCSSQSSAPHCIFDLFFFFFPPHVRWIFNFPLLSLPVLTSSSVKQAAMQTHETKGAEVYTNGSAGHMNGGQYTRMREVAFEKNPSEPMVRCQAWLDTHTHTVWSLDLPSWFHSLLSPAGSHSETKWQAEMHCGQNTAWRHDPQAR